MRKDLSDKTREEAWKLFDEEDLNVGEIANRLNISYSTAYNYTRLKARGYTPREYFKHSLNQRGYSSPKDYLSEIRELKKQNPKNIEFAKFLRKELKSRKKNQEWLAKKIGISRQMISLYINAIEFPTKEKLDSIYQVLMKSNGEDD